jgi:hypothetical protein
MKDTKYPSTCEGNVGSSGTQQVVSSATVVNPYFISFCRWPNIIVEGVQSCSTMAQKGRGSNTSKILVLLLIPFLSLSLSVPLSFLVIGKEVWRGRRIMRKDVGVRKGDHQL